MNDMKLNFRKAGGAFLRGAAVVLGVLMLTFLYGFSSRAETPGKVTAASANIRQTPDAGSTVVGSCVQGDTVSITNEVADSAGTVWYEVFVDSNTKGYIRSDLVQKSDGSAPSASTTVSAAPQESIAPETPVDVAAVQPQSGKVTGSDAVRVRSNASTTSQVVATAKSGVALTVTGQANGTDGKVWYQVNFINDGSEVTGFIRNDYVALDGELVPADQAPPEGDAGGEGDVPENQPQEPVQPPQESKEMETQLQGDEWYLINTVEGKQYNIKDLFNAVQENAKLYEDSLGTVKTQKIIVIVLVIVVVVLALGVTLLIFKIKDMTDAAYFEEVERDTVRSRNPDKKVMQTVGKDGASSRAGGRTGSQGGRPAASGNGRAASGSRPAVQGARPASDGRSGAKPAGTRPISQEGRAAVRPSAGQEGRPAGGRPASSEGRGARPGAGSAQGARPSGARPVQGNAPDHGSRPAAGRPAARAAGSQGRAGEPNPGWKSKNFMTDDDDEFEFEFLNWDGEDDQ